MRFQGWIKVLTPFVIGMLGFLILQFLIFCPIIAASISIPVSKAVVQPNTFCYSNIYLLLYTLFILLILGGGLLIALETLSRLLKFKKPSEFSFSIYLIVILFIIAVSFVLNVANN